MVCVGGFENTRHNWEPSFTLDQPPLPVLHLQRIICHPTHCPMMHQCEGKMCLEYITTLAHADGLEDDRVDHQNDPEARLHSS